jgi:hypothetical protein
MINAKKTQLCRLSWVACLEGNDVDQCFNKIAVIEEADSRAMRPKIQSPTSRFKSPKKKSQYKPSAAGEQVCAHR